VTITAQGIASPLCTVTLSNGTGSCGTSGTQVPPGSGYTYVAAYSGDTNFLPSNGSSANYTVTTAASTTTLVAPATGTFGSESALQFAPSVAPNIVAINPSPAPPTLGPGHGEGDVGIGHVHGVHLHALEQPGLLRAS